jgi:hypothetical protein
MAWIEFHLALRDHWKIKRLADIMGVEYITALGAVSCLWCWVAEYSPKGFIHKFSTGEIHDAARCNCEKFTLEALKTCELIDDKGRINDWNQHGIKLLESRRKRQREYMRRKRHVDVDSTSTIPNQPNLTIPNLTNKRKRFLYLSVDNLKKLKNIFKTDTELKKHLVDQMRFSEAEIDKAMGKEF